MPIDRKTWDQKYRRKNLEKCRAAVREHYHKNVELSRFKGRLKHQRRMANNPELVRATYRLWTKSPRGIFNSYRKNARKRGITIKITFEVFASLLNKQCSYCGTLAQGVDRVDSDRGYEVGNIVPCCGLCNRMKNSLSRDEFIMHCNRIASNLPNEAPL